MAEHLNHTILEKVQVMLHSSGQLRFLWGEAAHHAVCLKNHTLTKALDGLTPLEATTGKKPDLRGLHKWGCCVWVRNEASEKLGRHIEEGIWVSFDSKSKVTRSIGQRNVLFQSNGTPTLTCLVNSQSLTHHHPSWLDGPWFFDEMVMTEK